MKESSSTTKEALRELLNLCVKQKLEQVSKKHHKITGTGQKNKSYSGFVNSKNKIKTKFEWLHHYISPACHSGIYTSPFHQNSVLKLIRPTKKLMVNYSQRAGESKNYDMLPKLTQSSNVVVMESCSHKNLIEHSENYSRYRDFSENHLQPLNMYTRKLKDQALKEQKFFKRVPPHKSFSKSIEKMNWGKGRENINPRKTVRLQKKNISTWQRRSTVFNQQIQVVNTQQEFERQDIKPWNTNSKKGEQDIKLPS